MLDKILALSKGNNSVNEFIKAIRQGMPSAAFGVPESFKNYILSALEYPVLCVVKDSITAEIFKRELENFSSKKVVYIPPKDQTLLIARAFSKELNFQRIVALESIGLADIILVTPESLMQNYPNKICSLTVKRGDEYSRDLLIENLV
ncbi:MAG: hypothetical protein IJW47_01460, partial [Clostridia bacterium]|nr:hypothetical protein [Clostridia bacterium]